MTKRKTIAFHSTVHGHLWPGSEYLWAETARHLLLRGDSVFARFSSDFAQASTIQSLRNHGLRTATYSDRRTLRSKLLEKIPLRTDFVDKLQPDCLVVSAGSAFDPCYQPGLAKLLLNARFPFILICHFNAETFWHCKGERELMRSIFQKAKLAVFVSHDNLRITERQLAAEIPSAKIIRPPLPLSLEEPLPWPNSDNGVIRMACVARLDTRWKGQDVLLEALSTEKWQKRKWELTFYGEGEEKEYLQQLVNHFKLPDRVNFAGFVSDRSEIWRTNHLQVFATRGEGGPMVLTEGMSAGRPAVITDCGNTSEYVTDGVDGFLADFATAKCFERTLERAWQARNNWQTMGDLANRKIRSLKERAPHLELVNMIDSVTNTKA